MQPLLRVVPPVVPLVGAPLVALALLLAACGAPRPVAEQGPVCQSMAKLGQLPMPYPDITPAELQAEHAKETTRHYARAYGASRAAAPEPPPKPALPGVKATAFRRCRRAARGAPSRSASSRAGATMPASPGPGSMS